MGMGGIRAAAARKGVGATHEFRWRGGEITRFEGFSDAVLAFAVTLLVVSLEVPRTFDELLHSMRGFAAFAICFTMLVWVWYWQYLFFRRYGLQDNLTLVLNAALLFVVLFYVYPLKFLFTLVVNQFTGSEMHVRNPDGGLVPIITAQQGPTLMLIYGAGFVAIFSLFALLFLHAYRKRTVLELNPAEILDTRQSIQSALLVGSVGLLSMAIVFLGGERAVALSGYSYFLLGPVSAWHGAAMGRRRRSLLAARKSTR